MSSLHFLVSSDPAKFKSLDEESFDFESWRALKREASESKDKKTVRAYRCPEKHRGCGKRRCFRLHEFESGDRFAIQLWCLACGKFYVLEAQGEKFIVRALGEAMWLQDEAKAARGRLREVTRAAGL